MKLARAPATLAWGRRRVRVPGSSADLTDRPRLNENGCHATSGGAAVLCWPESPRWSPAAAVRPRRPALAEGADQLTIVAAAYPFQFVAERVAGDHGQVTSLTQPGSEPHDLELTPRQTASVIDADLVVYERTFQPAVDEAVAQSERDNALDTTTVVPLQDLGTEHDHGDAGRTPRWVARSPRLARPGAPGHHRQRRRGAPVRARSRPGRRLCRQRSRAGGGADHSR